MSPTSVVSPDRHYADHVLRDFINAAIEEWAQRLALPVIFVDLASEEWLGPMDSIARFSNYCRVMWDSSNGPQCRADHITRSKASVEPGEGCCYAGRYNFAYPVIANGLHVGTILCGQSLPPDDAKIKALASHNRVVRGLDPAREPELRSLLFDEFPRGRLVRRDEVDAALTELADVIGKEYELLSRVYPGNAFRPGETADPWSMMVHEIVTTNQAVMARAGAISGLVNRLPPSEPLIPKLVDAVANLREHIDLYELLVQNLFENSLGFPARTPVDLVAVFQRAIEAFKYQAEGEKIDIQVHFPHLARVVGSEDHLYLVAQNLISNALKYSYRTVGGRRRWVRVEVFVSDRIAEARVINYGVGILADEMEYIFGKYKRGKLGERERGTGSGLGLHTAKAIVSAHGGAILVASTPRDSGDIEGPHLVIFRVRLPSIGRL